MKKFITLTFAAMLCIGGFADHLKFKGIEIDSTIQYFCKQLETKGFVKSEDFESENTEFNKWYEGKFAGEYSIIGVFSDKNKTVSTISVSNVYDTEKEARDRYNYYKEGIEDNYTVDSTYTEVPLKNDITRKCYDVKNGTIKTIIKTTTNGSYHVIIYYIDFLNNFLRNLEEWVDKKDI